MSHNDHDARGPMNVFPSKRDVKAVNHFSHTTRRLHTDRIGQVCRERVCPDAVFRCTASPTSTILQFSVFVMPSVPIVHPQPLLAPLNPSAQQALAELLQAQTARKRLALHLSHAATHLTTIAGQLNDQGADRVQKRAKKLAKTVDQEEDEQEKAEHEEFQRKVDSLTQKMEEGIRSVIDEQHWIEGIPDAISYVVRSSSALAESTRHRTEYPTQVSIRGKTERNSSDERDEADEEAPDGDSCVPPQPQPSEAPTAMLQATLEERSGQWTSMSLTDRYAYANEYIGFYKIVHDAKHPGDNAPPVPHSSLWFAGEEKLGGLPSTRSQMRKGAHTDAEEDSDLEIASERISIKCPITFLPFKDPLTSTKCPHSFERAAILEMLQHTSTFLPFTPEQMIELSQISDVRGHGRREREIRVPAVKCPVCSIVLLEGDLRADPVLLRKVKRIQAAREEQEEGASDMDDDDGGPRGAQSKPVALGSSPPRRISGRLGRVKEERAQSRARSVVPQMQLTAGTPSITPGGATVIDIGVSDEDEDEDLSDE